MNSTTIELRKLSPDDGLDVYRFVKYRCLGHKVRGGFAISADISCRILRPSARRIPEGAYRRRRSTSPAPDARRRAGRLRC